ncbi:MAG: 50S ribosomal protein L15 [Bacteroidetes bacterium]|nr:50S ribosomal protein L15 [Bacteroidota bacterium]
MQLHNIRQSTRRKTKKRIGRGGKRGTYSGRGMKGQKSRSGARFQPLVRELFKRYPKLRGYRTRRFGTDAVVVNLGTIEKHFAKGEVVSPESLNKKNIIRTIKKRLPLVKILGKGSIKKAVTIEGCECSKSVKEQIVKAGGTIAE